MRRSASEIINELEHRIARLEKKAILGLFKSSPLEKAHELWLKGVNESRFIKSDVKLDRNKKLSGRFQIKGETYEINHIKSGGDESQYKITGGNKDFREVTFKLVGEHTKRYKEKVYINKLIDHLGYIIGQESARKEIEEQQRLLQEERDSHWRRASHRRANDIASTIVRQLGGGRKLQMMIGLRQLINEPNGVTLVFPKPKHKGAVNRVRIKYDIGLDLYDMEFIRTHGRSVKVVKEFKSVYAEDLKDRFEDGTGLYIRF